MFKVLLVFVGSGVGGVLRLALTEGIQRFAGPSFPLGTLTVNVLGCLAMGILGGAFAGQTHIRDEHRLLLMVGLLGGFTTFSAFGRETVALADDGRLLLAGLNIALSNGLGLGAIWLGGWLAGRLHIN